jgi:putative transcriptional regulator
MVAPGAGILLIADPFLKDPNFQRTVVFLCDHQQEGSFGFILNRPFEMELGELLESASGISCQVFVGGPVQPDTIHFLHQYPDLLPGCTRVTKDIYWGGEFETVLALLRDGIIQQDKIKFYIGYSGWGEGQLQDELAEKTWLTVAATASLIFDSTPTQCWQDSLRHMGGEYQSLVHYPIDPQLN